MKDSSIVTAGQVTSFMYSDVYLEVIDIDTGEVLYHGKNLDFMHTELGYDDEVEEIVVIEAPYHIRLMVDHEYIGVTIEKDNQTRRI